MIMRIKGAIPLIYLIAGAGLGVGAMTWGAYIKGVANGKEDCFVEHQREVMRLETALKAARDDAAQRVRAEQEKLRVLQAQSEKALKTALRASDEHIQKCWNTNIGQLSDSIWMRD